MKVEAELDDVPDGSTGVTALPIAAHQFITTPAKVEPAVPTGTHPACRAVPTGDHLAILVDDLGANPATGRHGGHGLHASCAVVAQPSALHHPINGGAVAAELAPRNAGKADSGLRRLTLDVPPRWHLLTAIRAVLAVRAVVEE